MKFSINIYKIYIKLLEFIFSFIYSSDYQVDKWICNTSLKKLSFLETVTFHQSFFTTFERNINLCV